MKKTYISPVANTYNLNATAILAGSEQTLESGGSNKDKGINDAEAKVGGMLWEDYDM